MEAEPIKDNRKRLRVLMELHELSAADVSVLIDVSIHTINSYRSRSGLEMPDNLLELLEYKLADE